jgi:hypothetical protein
VRQKLADRDSLFAPLRELRPLRAHAFLVVEPAPRVGDGECHGGQPFGGRVDEHHGVLLPGFAGVLIANTTPEVNDLVAAVICAARASELPASNELSANVSRTDSWPRMTCPSTDDGVVADMGFLADINEASMRGLRRRTDDAAKSPGFER